jgi:hypothetical protein
MILGDNVLDDLLLCCLSVCWMILSGVVMYDLRWCCGG